MRKILLTLTLITTLTALGMGLAQETVTLLFWPGPESEAMQEVIDAFNTGPGQ